MTDPAPRIPAWAPDADRLLAAAATRIRVVGASTPVNLSAELARLVDLWTRFGACAPSFTYAPPPDLAALRVALDRVAEGLWSEGDIGALYAARARELEIEAAICEAAGGPGCWPAARRRYAPRDACDGAADDLAAAWLTAAAEDLTLAADHDEPTEEVWSDDEREAGSLVTRMRQEIGARRLPFRVVVMDIAPLAATGDGSIQIAARRRLTREDVERTVLHEVEGHAAPAARAQAMPIGLFAIGTARGSDDQEGRALALERAAGYLRGARRRELALRHLGARHVERGADFVETAQALLDAGAPTVRDALRITARVHRGGGLGRESVYLPALIRVEATLRDRPDLGWVLGAGRVAVNAAPILAAWTPPAPLPP